MKIEKLTDNKIRIIFNLDELSEKNIDLHSLSQNNENTHSLFKFILDEAEKQVGFKVKDCKLFIEAFSSSDGYVIFTLTKYKNELKTDSTNKKLRFKRKTFNNSYKNAIYKFNNFEEFCNFCTYCSTSVLADLKGFCKNISLYEYNNFYYLIFSNINSDFKYTRLFYASISEFSSLVSSSIIFRSKLDEHGKNIFKNNAIQKGIKYFVNI
jgi:adapter protein MecA 1/2